MPVPVQINHVEESLTRLISQWQDKPVIVGLLTSYMNQFNDLETAYFQLLQNRSIYDAEGINLDIIGALFDVDRSGRNDSDYRAAILLKISQLQVDGTTEVFLNALRNIGDTNLVDFWEHYDADVHAYMGAGVNSKTYSQVENTVPAGVNIRVIFDDKGDSLLPVELLPNAADLQADDGITVSDLQVDNGTTISDLQVQTFISSSNIRGYLPEIEDISRINPLAELITQDSYSYTGNFIFENGDFMIDENGNLLTWTDYTFI